MEKITKDHELAASQNPVTTNIAKLRELFPSIVSEDKIDFEALRQLLGDEVTEDEEYFRFVWPGKKQARAEALKPSTGTLRPAPEESLDWDTTQNVYIEGDNLEVLKLLQRSYAGKVKMIYIDPPYNTGKDFVYKDNYRDNLANYRDNYGRKDEAGNLVATQAERNSESSGRYHSNWLNMMYPRLQLARNLLKEDGVIFISIDDNELENLKKLGHEVFGESNFIGQWNWFKSGTPPNLSKKIKKNLEYILCYEKKRSGNRYLGVEKTSASDDPMTKKQNSLKELTFSEGTLQIGLKDQIIKSGIYGTDIYPNELLNDLVVSNGTNANIVTFRNRFIWTQENLEAEIANGTAMKIAAKSLVIAYKKAEYDAELPPNLIGENVGVSTTENAGKKLRELMGVSLFSYPKPVNLLSYLTHFIDLTGEIVLDFFSGSGTTAESVIRDSLDTRFILVQIPQKLDPSEASDPSERQLINNGIDFLINLKRSSTLAELGKERIRRVVKKIKEEEPEKAKDMDLGFRVFKLDSSNIEAWDSDPEKLEENLFSDNIKADRTEHDLVYEILLKYGLDLSLPITERPGPDTRHTLYAVGGGALFLCLGAGITRRAGEAILGWAEEIGAVNPKVVFRDTGFTSSVEKTNAYEVLRSGGVTDVKSV